MKQKKILQTSSFSPCLPDRQASGIRRLLLMLACSVAIFAGAQAQKNNMTVSRNNDRFTMSIKNDSEKLSLTVKGDITLTDDDKNVKKLSSDGSVEYKKNNRSLEITNSTEGNLLYTINDVKKTALSDEDRSLVEECVRLMINSGIDADNRVERIFAQKGATGVLNEIDNFNNDYVKEIYLSRLLKNQKLSQQEMIALLNKTDQYLASDYYKSELLNGVMASFLHNEATSDAYLNTVSNMKSDYYQYTTIKRLLEVPLNEKQFGRILAVVKGMRSDYYESEVLKSLLSENNFSDRKFSEVMEIAGGMKSDYYKSEIIMALLKSKSLSSNRYSQTIAAMQGMKSSYYQSVILTRLVDEKITDETEWNRLIRYAGNIDSDYYQSEVLIKIASRMPDSESLKKELTNTAKKIRSDYYYGRVIRAMQKDA